MLGGRNQTNPPNEEYGLLLLIQMPINKKKFLLHFHTLDGSSGTKYPEEKLFSGHDDISYIYLRS